jgi:predicted Rossmann fold nucleotide-binding protein DprA/Smf involved in DNA uptake
MMNMAYVNLPVERWQKVAVMGNEKLLRLRPTALFCSVKCPGELIVKTYDLILDYRKIGVPVISGFHSPMEKECLRLLLKGTQPVIICPARSIETLRIPKEWRSGLEEGRLAVVSPFPEEMTRVTRKTALLRNRFVGDLAGPILVSYAEPGGQMEQLCRVWLEQGKTVLTFDAEYNNHLLAMGVSPV